MKPYVSGMLVLVIGLMFAAGGRADDKKDDKAFSDAEFVKKAAVGGVGPTCPT